MKAKPCLISWHDDCAPIYSAHFQPRKNGRFATAGGDNNVRLWKYECSGDDSKVVYLSTLVKHTQAVNVVRWSPNGKVLASAGDDGNVLLWIKSDHQDTRSFGQDDLGDRETWRVKHMCRSLGSEVYDLAWSPDSAFFITGSMDNIARIYNANTGQIVRQMAEHKHYVQGVAWDPLNEFIATQSSDRSVNIYTLTTNDGRFALPQYANMSKMDLPTRRPSHGSPAPSDPSAKTGRGPCIVESSAPAVASPVPSAPDTPASLVPPSHMNPPTAHSRRSSFGSQSRCSVSPASSAMPLPAVMPSVSPMVHAGLAIRSANIYANETLTSFFRRLTFAPDGSLLLTPAGQYKPPVTDHSDAPATGNPDAPKQKKPPTSVINTIYIYTRAGLNKPPVAHLPGHSKPSVAVRCSPVVYTLRDAAPATNHITIDTSSAEEMHSLPEPAMSPRPQRTSSPIDPQCATSASSPRPNDTEADTEASPLPPGPTPAFSLAYRIIYAVATQDAVLVYDTQQHNPLCIVSNLHLATFTDLAWTNDGNMLLMTSSDGFCSSLTFSPGELGEVYHHRSIKEPPPPIRTGTSIPSSNHSTPVPTPTHASASSAGKPVSSTTPAFLASPSPAPPVQPVSPTPSTSASSNMAPGHHRIVAEGQPPPSISAVPSITAANSGPVGQVPIWTPPQTPIPGAPGKTHSTASSVSGVHPPPSGRPESELGKDEEPQESKKRRGGVASDGSANEEPTLKKKKKKKKTAPAIVEAADGGAATSTPPSAATQDEIPVQKAE